MSILCNLFQKQLAIEIDLLREQNALLAKLVAQNQPLQIDGIGHYVKAKADDVIVARNSHSDTRRYYQ